jgi:ABC-type transport system involved in cytochrome c biogenesis permease subunit
MNRPGDNNQTEFKSAVTITVVGVAVVTFVVIFIALFAGLWLDKIFSSRPIFTVSLVILSIPATIVLMLQLVKLATSRIKPTAKKSSEEETNRGTDS